MFDGEVAIAERLRKNTQFYFGLRGQLRSKYCLIPIGSCTTLRQRSPSNFGFPLSTLSPCEFQMASDHNQRQWEDLEMKLG